MDDTVKKGKGELKHHIRNELPENMILYHKSSTARLIASLLDSTETAKIKGDFDAFIGKYKGLEIAIVNTGMGAGTTAMVVEQAAYLGVKRIFKMGTFGALQDDIRVGDVVLVTGAVRSEGLTDAYAPMYYPALPDFSLTTALAEKLKEMGLSYRTGMVHSVNIYSKYYEVSHNPEKYSPYIYRSLGVLGVEMETSSTFVCSTALGVQSAALLVCNRTWEAQEAYIRGEEVKWEMGGKRKEEALLNCGKAILEVISKETDKKI